MAFQFAIAQRAHQPTLLKTLTKLSLTTNLKICLDPSDDASYTSGQKWLDTSGNGTDFFLGADGSVTASDPTFTGAPSSHSSSTYWAFDGGDYFTYDSANETWMQNLHKDNATFSFALLAYLPTSGGSSRGVFGTYGDVSTGTGISLNYNLGHLFLNVLNAGANVRTIDLQRAPDYSAWNFIACSLDEATGAAIVQINEDPFTIASQTYSSPAAGSASQTMQIGATGNAQNPLKTGSRVGPLAMWGGTALSAGNLTSIYNEFKVPYGV